METPHLQTMDSYKKTEMKSGIASENDSTSGLNKRDLRIGLRHRDSLAVYKSSMTMGPLNRDFLGDGVSIEPKPPLQKLKQQLTTPDPDDNPTLSAQDPSTSSNGSSDTKDSANVHKPAKDIASPRSGTTDDNREQTSTEDDANSIDSSYSSDDDVSERPTLDSVGAMSPPSQEADAPTNYPILTYESPNTEKKKKNKLKSMAKGMGSFLGLRKSKKKRRQEEFERMVIDATEFNTAVNAGLPPEVLPASPALRSIPNGNVYSSPLATSASDLFPTLSGDIGSPPAGAESPRANLGRLFLRKSKSEILTSTTESPTSAFLHARSKTQDQIATQSPLSPYLPPRDSTGAFLPSHHVPAPIKSIMKTRSESLSNTPTSEAPHSQRSQRSNTFVVESPSRADPENPPEVMRSRSVSNLFLYRPSSMSASMDEEAQMKSIAAAAAEAMYSMQAGDGRNGDGSDSRKSQRRGISFADQHGHHLKNVRFCDNLHYSEGSLHDDWDDEWDDSKNCTIM